MKTMIFVAADNNRKGLNLSMNIAEIDQRASSKDTPTFVTNSMDGWMDGW